MCYHASEEPVKHASNPTNFTCCPPLLGQTRASELCNHACTWYWLPAIRSDHAVTGHFVCGIFPMFGDFPFWAE